MIEILDTLDERDAADRDRALAEEDEFIEAAYRTWWFDQTVTHHVANLQSLQVTATPDGVYVSPRRMFG